MTEVLPTPSLSSNTPHKGWVSTHGGAGFTDQGTLVCGSLCSYIYLLLLYHYFPFHKQHLAVEWGLHLPRPPGALSPCSSHKVDLSSAGCACPSPLPPTHWAACLMLHSLSWLMWNSGSALSYANTTKSTRELKTLLVVTYKFSKDKAKFNNKM